MGLGMNFEVKPLAAGLYFVATPIGTARDITLRALDVMASADVLASEDTRTTRKLMEIHGVPLNDRKMVAFHDHSGEGVIKYLVSEILGGKSVAYFSEAGTPLIADPGYELGVAAREAGVDVTAAPGASAVVNALTLSALPTDRFAFVGFLPNARQQRETEIAELRDLPFTLVFYESPKRIGDSLRSLRDVLGASRQAAVCREMTKRFEEVSRGSLEQLAEEFAERNVKGEIVLLVGRAGAVEVSESDVMTALEEALTTMRVKDAATAVSGALGLPRKQVYQMALQLKDKA
jgi:16S rRNA (cytidine1402-2'-O)-methyltransferase